MRIFLLWRPARPEAARPPAAVGAALQRLFTPLFTTPPALHVRSAGGVHLVWLELPIRGFRAPFHEEAGARFAFAPDYPLNARRLLRTRGALPADGRALLALGRELEGDPEPLVRELIPPAALVWSAADGSVRVQNDGLGQAQLLEHDDGHTWALTNRAMALRALDLELRPVADEWAARFVTNWFPLDRTGYENVRALAGGTQLRIDAAGVTRRRFDALGEWVRPAPRTRADALELGRQGLLDHLSDAIELWERPSVGLSGGWDSRAVAACLRHLGADFELRVRGQETHFDVILSAELARIAGLPHRIKSEGGIPPGNVEGLRASIARALLWQGGSFATKKHKNFLAKDGKDGLDGGVVNVMGQHAGVGKADFVTKTEATKHADGHEERLLDGLFADAPGCLRAARAGSARELIRASYRAADVHGLDGLRPLLFFYLSEFTRRWGSATVASQTGLVVSPFLNPDVIRACCALPPEELPTKPLHRHVTALHAPDWAAVPYADQVSEADFASGRLPRVERKPEPAEPADTPRWRSVRHHRKYHYKFYWKDVGQPLLQEAFEQGGFWTEVFEPSAARSAWAQSGSTADALSVAHLLPRVLAGELPAAPLVAAR
ncbi:MAG TPA: hypothetical protein VF530_14915 [Planctomycetota bacterium]